MARWIGQPEHVRRGSISVELLLNLPIWLMLLLGTVEFGSVLTHLAQVSLASRVGADAASRVMGLANRDEVPEQVLAAVGRQLAASGIACGEVILEHNVGGRSRVLASDQRKWKSGATGLPEAGTYVRVTVRVPWKALGPRLLERILPGVSSQVLSESTTRRYQVACAEAS